MPVDNPNITVDHKPTVCLGCGTNVQTDLLRFLDERREIEIPPITVEWIAHRIYSYYCPECHTTTNGEFPYTLPKKSNRASV